MKPLPRRGGRGFIPLPRRGCYRHLFKPCHQFLHSGKKGGQEREGKRRGNEGTEGKGKGWEGNEGRGREGRRRGGVPYWHSFKPCHQFLHHAIIHMWQFSTFHPFSFPTPHP